MGNERGIKACEKQIARDQEILNRLSVKATEVLQRQIASKRRLKWLKADPTNGTVLAVDPASDGGLATGHVTPYTSADPAAIQLFPGDPEEIRFAPYNGLPGTEARRADADELIGLVGLADGSVIDNSTDTPATWPAEDAAGRPTGVENIPPYTATAADRATMGETE